MNPKSLFEKYPDLKPRMLRKDMKIADLLQLMGQTCFEARNLFRGAELFRQMIDEGDTIWLGIAGAGIAGGMGGMVISLMKAGFIHLICSTGAQVYHDLHFAFGLPVKQIPPNWDDNQLRRHGDTRIYDIGIREKETLEAQDAILRKFVKEKYDLLRDKPLSSWEFNYILGQWVNETAPHPDLSFVAKAADFGIPVFWDSHTNHSIAMNLVKTDQMGFPVRLSAQKDIFDSAALAFASRQTGFIELGGGGPKNFIQQTGPTISQILGVEFEGADRGLQIGTAVEREGSLSSCTFGEAVTWGKYQENSIDKLVQIWAEYSLVFPLISAYVLDRCSSRKSLDLISQMSEVQRTLEDAS